jgi:hypothetical protein
MDQGERLETMTSLPAPPPELLPLNPEARDPSPREPRPATRKHDAHAGIPDRRRASRYVTEDTPALIAWIEGGNACKFTATLKNISADGAMLETEYEPLPPPETSVMLRLACNLTDWVMKAKIVGVTTLWAPARFSFRKKPQERVGSHIRLAFIEPCPYDFFKASITGFVVERARVRSV